jgi:hypothetical protein
MRCHHCAEAAVVHPRHRGVRVGVCGAHLRAELERLRRTAAAITGELAAAEGAE